MQVNQLFLTLGAVAIFIAGCSAIYQETRLVYNPKNPGWIKDSVDQHGYYTVKCTRRGVILKAPGILDSRLSIRRVGPPVVPLAPFSRSSEQRNRPIFTNISVSSPHDSTTIDLRDISLYLPNDTVVHRHRYNAMVGS